MGSASNVYFSLLAVVGVYYALYWVMNGGLVGYGLLRSGRMRRRQFMHTLIAGDEQPSLTVIIPAYNEQATIVSVVQSTLRLPTVTAVVVVDDGSADDTAAVLINEYQLTPTTLTAHSELSGTAVQQAWATSGVPLTLISCTNGGKASAINVGVNHTDTTLVAVVDADTRLEASGVAAVVNEFRAHPATVAASGSMRVANTAHPHTKKRALVEWVQTLEYVRAFAGWRAAWSQAATQILISGGFGVFRADAVRAVGGFDVDSIGEDFEFTMRMQRCGDLPVDAEVRYIPVTACWTYAPDRLAALTKQRRRWQQGLAQTLTRHRGAWSRRRGSAGTVALSMMWVFELVGPIVEVASWVLLAIGWRSGFLSTVAVLGVVVTSGLLAVAVSALSVAADYSPADGHTPRQAWTLVGAAALEGLGYRQWMVVVRVAAMLSMRNGVDAWDSMPRDAAALTVNSDADDAMQHPNVSDYPGSTVQRAVAAPARDELPTVAGREVITARIALRRRGVSERVTPPISTTTK